MEKEYDIIIVGAGPAGIFAAHKLSKNKDLKICLIDMGKSIKNRQKHEVMCGVGGSGTFSDGKLHFSIVLSHEKMLHLYTENEYQKYVDDSDKLFRAFGDTAEDYPKNMEEVQKLVDNCKQNNIHLVVRRIRHVGSNKLPLIIGRFEDELIKNNVIIKTNTEILDIIQEDNQIKGVIDTESNKYIAKKVLLAPGRFNTKWLQDLSKKYGIKYHYDKVEVGVRVEFPEVIMRKYAELMYEAVFKIQTKTYDDCIRTFCPCHKGQVAEEKYNGYVCVNGHSNDTYDSPNSNFAFLTEIELTEPIENTTEYAKSIAHLASTIGGGKPIIQRLADLKKGRRSTWSRIKKSYTDPSLKNVVPGDISMALPHRTVTNIIEGLDALNEVMPGINSGNTFIYAPEVKFRASKIETDKHLQTKIKGLYVAGDAAGVSGNIVGAAATGLIAAEGILKN